MKKILNIEDAIKGEFYLIETKKRAETADYILIVSKCLAQKTKGNRLRFKDILILSPNTTFEDAWELGVDTFRDIYNLYHITKEENPEYWL